MHININDVFRHMAQQQKQCIDITSEVEIGPSPYEVARLKLAEKAKLTLANVVSGEEVKEKI